MGRKTLLIDLDTQGHSAIGLGCMNKLDNVPGIHKIFVGDAFKLQDMIVTTDIDNLSLISADLNFAGDMAERKVMRLSNVLNTQNIEQDYERIIIDTPPTLDMLLMNAFASAHAVLVPFLPHYLSGVGVRQLAKLHYKMFAQYNTSLKYLALLPMMFDRRVKIHKRVMQEITDEFGAARILRGIRSNIQLVEAFESGMPIRSYAPQSRGAMDYRLLAEELEVMWFQNA